MVIIVCTILLIPPMTKFKQALNRSLQAENQAVQSRFDRAEAVIRSDSEKSKSNPAPPLQAIRDTFSFPSDDYALIAQLQQRCLQSATVVNKSELVRAGLHALSDLPNEQLLQLIGHLTRLKTGRKSTK